MEERIARFVAALRAAGVRVSLAESEDAWRAIRAMGVIDRDRFRWSLRATLVKEAADIPIFEELFPLFFGADQPPMLNPQEGLSPEERDMLQQAIDDLAGDLQRLLDWLLSGRQPTKEELQELAEQAGIDLAEATRLKLAKNDVKYPVEISYGSSRKYSKAPAAERRDKV